MDKDKTLETIEQYWEPWYVAGISDFIRVPNLTPMCDPNYTTNGLLEKAIDLVDSYIQKLEIVGLERRIFRPEGMLPLIVYVVPPSEGQTRNIMMYGHVDKQPYEEPWDEGLGPITPVIKDGKLYGRGGADDGYSSFSAMLAVKAAQLQGVKMPRIVLVLETEEESGSDFLISLLKTAEDYIQKPDVLICLDSGCLDYD